MRLIFFIIFFLLSTPVKASDDLIINCDLNSCTKINNFEFFNEKNIAPGFSKSKTIKVQNQRSDNCNLQFKLNQTSLSNPLSSVQMLSIFEEDTLKIAGPLNSLSDDKYHNIGNIDNNQYKVYRWTVSLDQTLGNDYQQLNSFFDLDLNFVCADSNESDNRCLDTPPASYPTNFKATAGQNSVTLTWDETEDSFSYYLISYSTQNHAATFANANIGGRGTTTYTIYNLEADRPYYFKIRTGNFCAPGPFSNIIFATPTGQKIFNSNFSDNHPKILGETNHTPSIPSLNPVTRVTKCFNIFPYAFILALLINIIISRYRLLTFFISFLSLLSDYYLNKYLCRNYHYFYVNNFLSFILPFIFSLKKPKT